MEKGDFVKFINQAFFEAWDGCEMATAVGYSHHNSFRIIRKWKGGYMLTISGKRDGVYAKRIHLKPVEERYVMFKNEVQFDEWIGSALAKHLGYNSSLAYKITKEVCLGHVQIILQNGDKFWCSNERVVECDDRTYPTFKRGDEVNRKGSHYWFIVDKYHNSCSAPWLVGRSENTYIRQDELEHHVKEGKPKYFPSITLAKKIEIMSAALAGKPIEICKSGKNGVLMWVPVQDVMSLDWDWSSLSYRVAEIQDTVDWNEVGEGFDYIARNKHGIIVAYSKKPSPEIAYNGWAIRNLDNETISVKIGEGDVCVIPSFKKGSVDWDKSLIERPKK